MHLRGCPQYFVKDGKRRAAYYTAEATELLSLGWEREQTQSLAVSAPDKSEEPSRTAKPEQQQPEKIDVEIVEEPVKPQGSVEKKEEVTSFEFMTRVELLEYAQDRGVDLSNSLRKAELVAACKKLA